jgi:CRISPR type III-A-associated protein Csm2
MGRHVDQKNRTDEGGEVMNGHGYKDNRSWNRGGGPGKGGGGPTGSGSGGAQATDFSFKPRDVEKILSGDGETMVRLAEELAREIGKFPRSQMRSFYGPVVRLRHDLQSSKEDNSQVIRNRLHLVRARLAYTVERETGKAAKPLKNAMDVLVGRPKNSQEMARLFDFIEALVAYHYGFSK